jgi:alcohol dehydrogenase (cytochrome c)
MADAQFRAHALAGVAAAVLASTLIGTPGMARDMSQQRAENPQLEPNNWINHAANYAGHRFVNLNQINRSNVQNLSIKMMVNLNGQYGSGSRYALSKLEGTPLVEDGFMFVPDGWGATYKIDLRSGKRADIVWVMDPKVDKVWAGDVACCGVNNRGVGLWKDQVITATLDGRLIATNKETGQVTWERKVADPDDAETLTVAPLIIRDLAIVGPAGAEFGIRGWLDATDLSTGKQKWRTYTIPAKGEKGNETWVDKIEAWKTGGGSIWVTGTYDPAINMMYWGTGNPAPQIDAEFRPGDNLHTESALAMNPDDGSIKWTFQYTPNDPYDYDEISEHPIVDVMIDGQERKAVFHAGRNGFYYAFDRVSGQFLYGKPYVDLINWTDGLDPKTGRPLSYNPATPLQNYKSGTVPRRGKVGVYCPALGGGKNWEPQAYNPVRKTMFVPSIEGCSAYVAADEGVKEKLGGTTKQRVEWDGRDNAPAGTNMPINDTKYSVQGIDVQTGAVRNQTVIDFKIFGVVATAGDLVFGGNLVGDLIAWDAESLAPLWTFNVGSAINGPPMSFAVDGKQYLAVLVGGRPGAAVWRVRPSSQFFGPSNYVMVFSL